MAYRADGTATFIGLERVTGRLGNRSGSFVLEHSGSFEGGMARASWFVVAGSGTGELSGLRGEGGFEASHQTSYPMRLSYYFE